MKRLLCLTLLCATLVGVAEARHEGSAEPRYTRALRWSAATSGSCESVPIDDACRHFAAYDRRDLVVHAIAGRDQATPSLASASASVSLRLRDDVPRGVRAVTYTLAIQQQWYRLYHPLWGHGVHRPVWGDASISVALGGLPAAEQRAARKTVHWQTWVLPYEQVWYVTLVHRSPTYARGARLPGGRVEPRAVITASAENRTPGVGVDAPGWQQGAPASGPAPGRVESMLYGTVRGVVARSGLMLEHIAYASDGLENTNANLNKEFVVVRNVGTSPLSTRHWRLTDDQRASRWNSTFVNEFRFPDRVLRPGAAVRIHTGKGKNTATDLYWGKTDFVWDDLDDRAWLWDRFGPQVCSYTWREAGKEDCWR